jgi:hypothetical protein
MDGCPFFVARVSREHPYPQTKGPADAESPVVPKTQKSQPKKISFFMVLQMVGLLGLEPRTKGL